MDPLSIIRFIFSGDSSGLDQAANKGKKSLEGLRKEALEGISTAAKWSAGLVAASVAVGAAMVKMSLSAIDSQAKLARSIGSTVEGLEAVTRAGKISGVSVGQVESAAKSLTNQLSSAAAGTGPAVDALKRLGLSAQDVIALPLDQRINTINNSINSLIPAAERAAVAAQVFGKSGADALTAISSDAIRQAAEDAEAFGGALSSVDAAKVEAASQTMARARAAIDNMVKKFSAEIAPIIDAIGKLFLKSAADSGKFQDAGTRAADAIIKGMAFAMDAVEGLRRAFQVAGQAIAAVMLSIRAGLMGIAATIVEGPINQLNNFVRMANRLPKVNIPEIDQPEIANKLRREMEISVEAVKIGAAEIQETLMKPLPGGQFLKFVEDAKEAAQEAAEAIASAQSPSVGPESGANQKDRDAAEKRLDALRKSYQSELQALQEKFGIEQEILEEARELQLISEMEYKTRLLEVEQGYQSSVTDLEEKGRAARMKIAEAEARARKQVMGKALSDLSTLMNSESKKMFEVGKAAAISQTIIDTYAGAQSAFSAMSGIPIVGPVLGAAAAAAAIAGGLARVQSIRSQSFGSGGTPSVSNTQAVNNASTPVSGGGGGESGPMITLAGLNPDSFYDGRQIIAVINEAVESGARMRIA